MTDFNDFTDLAAIERERDLPPDEPYVYAVGAVECPNCDSDDLFGQDDGHWLCNECGCEFDE